jgi:NADP-dependent 3-hydroxy acid dehydrogenase YdfG
VYNRIRMKAADMFSLKGRVALVTGASSGLGVQFAKALADNGAAVALVARRADRLKSLKDELKAKVAARLRLKQTSPTMLLSPALSTPLKRLSAQ